MNFDDVEPPLTVLVFRDEGLGAPHLLRKHRLRQPGRGSRADEHFEKASLPGRSEGLWHRRRREEKPPNFDPIKGLSHIRIFFWTSKASRATKGRATPPRQKGRSMTISRSLRFERNSASSRSQPLPQPRLPTGKWASPSKSPTVMSAWALYSASTRWERPHPAGTLKNLMAADDRCLGEMERIDKARMITRDEYVKVFKRQPDCSAAVYSYMCQ